MATVVIHDETELMGVADTLLALPYAEAAASILALKGDLGAGKTTLTKAIARHLGVKEHVTSPTFVIMKLYALHGHERFHTLVHIDAYRIEEERELTVLGFTERIKDPGNLIVIEWPEHVMGLLPQSTHTVSLTIGAGGERIISYGE